MIVYRVGTGSAALNSNATAVFLDEYTPSGTLVQSIALPTTDSGANQTLTASGTATSEGLLTLSADGQYLILTGYDAAPGTASITGSASATINRVIGRVDAAGNVNTSTALTDAISGGNPRSATSTNGTDLWISGTSSGGGIRYATLGSTTSTALNTTPVTNLRQANIFDGQLYISAASGTLRLGTVGTGTPTTPSQTITNLPGIDSTNVTGPYAYFFADLNAGVAGNDTLYIADEGANQIKKFSLVSGTWTANGTVASTAVRGITGVVSGSNVTLYTTSNGTSIGTLTDTSGYNATITGTLTSIATNATNTAIRGIALAPGSGAPTPTPTPTPSLSINNVSQDEGNAGTTNFNFTVSLSQPAQTGGVSFTVNTADGTTNPATAGSDYVAITGGAGSIPEGSSSTQVTVQVNGDTTPEPNETFFVNITNVTGAGVTDAQGLGTIQNDEVVITPIHDIQGNGNASPRVGEVVTTTGIVTGRKTNGYFIQDPVVDADPNTSEAMFVFTSSAPSASITVGDSVRVTGTVAEFISATSDEPVTPSDPKTATEITSPTTTILSTGNPLPAPLTEAILVSASPSRSAELEKYEYMRVSISSLTVTQPTNNNFGEFWGVTTGTPRPFREPGIEAGDPIPAADDGPFAGSVPPNIPIFDGNFERILIDSDEATNTSNTRRNALFVTTGAVVTGIVGPLDYAFDDYRINIDFNATTSVTPGITAAIPVPTPTASEFTISHANLENFSSSNATKLNKASLAIRNVLHTPDVVGLIEIDTAASAQALANKINSDVGNPSAVNYVSYFSETSATQDIGYLVNSARVTVVGTPTPYHAGTTFTYCNETDTLHDRPSFVLNVTFPQQGGGNVPVTIILNHTKSLIGVDSQVPRGTCGTGTDGGRNREKRRQQAEDIADLIQSHINENLVVLGDMNAFDFNDGLQDMVGTLKGTPAPANQVVEPSTDRWTYTLTNLINTLPADQRYSFAFEGNAQALDHVLVNTAMLERHTRYAYARYNGDFSNDFATNANTPERVADHDAPVAYFSAAAPNPDLAITKTADRNPAPVELNFNYNITVTNTGSPAANTVVTDTLPSQVTLTAATTSQGTCSYDSGTRTVTCNLGTVSAGSPVNIQLTVKPREEGTLNNTASVTTSDTDSNLNNNSASVNGLPAIKQTDLSVQKTAAPNPIFVSQNVTYTMVVKNNSTVVGATGVVLTDSLPASMTFVSATTSQGTLVTPPVGSSGIVTANLGSLGIGATATVTVTVTATATGVISNTATVTGNESDPLAANNTDSATTTVNAVNLQKVLLAKQVLIGGCENTTGNVYLTGPAPAGGLTVSLSTTSLAGVTVPASVFIPAGQTVSPAFNVTTSPVVAKQVGLVTATLGMSSVSRNLTINVGSGTCPP
ncbi:MAG TPA: endonuclease/exonuclease/phosphatase family protein [Pyrinomonadaceae bacterium]|nr:endonuclease/exonuclease/phosphatase family protein [Pyrinomonadaceae bacterium]